MVRDASTDQGSRLRLFYRSTAPVRDTGETLIGRLIVYRDVSKEWRLSR